RDSSLMPGQWPMGAMHEVPVPDHWRSRGISRSTLAMATGGTHAGETVLVAAVVDVRRLRPDAGSAPGRVGRGHDALPAPTRHHAGGSRVRPEGPGRPQADAGRNRARRRVAQAATIGVVKP